MVNSGETVHTGKRYTVTMYSENKAIISGVLTDSETNDTLTIGGEDMIELEYQSILADGYSDSLVRSFWHMVQVNNH